MTKVGQEKLDALEEQRRINEETSAAEAEAIMGQQIELKTEIDCLERERETKSKTGSEG